MLEVKELVKSYGTGKNQHQVLRGVDLTIHKGEFAAVMGPSGSGKTTLLDCISRYKPFESGEVLLNGKDLGKLNEKEMAKVRNEKIGFVFQDFMLLDGLTVFDNVCVPQVIKGENYRSMEKRASKLLKMFDIEKIKKKYPAEISGGQKQRTAVARALINDPLMILADEPTGNLDSRSSEAVIEAFITAKKQLQATILMVTHDSLSASYCDRVILMRDGVVCDELVRTGDRRAFFNELMDVLRKLGGNNDHIKKILADQLRRVYTLPTILGCLLMLLWYPLMLWQNDGRFTQAEMRIVFVEAALCAVIALFQYVVYRISMRQAKKAVSADEGV